MDDSDIQMFQMEDLSEEQQKEAMAIAAAAQRAEERAEQRALERAMERKRQERLAEKQQQSRTTTSSSLESRLPALGNGHSSASSMAAKVKFLTKKQREAMKNGSNGRSTTTTDDTKEGGKNGTAAANPSTTTPSTTTPSAASAWTAQERQEIRKAYLGTSTAALARNGKDDPLPPEQGRQKKQKKGVMGSKKSMFRFEWDDTDDTLQTDDLLYSGAVSLHSNNNASHGILNSKKRKAQAEEDRAASRASRRSPASENNINTKPLDQMTPRDWRILRENYEIVTKGGRAPPPMRSFEDGNLLHPDLLRALKTVMKYRDPTPIQRQAIPIGMQRRDMIGIAETGSGKTYAFGCPLVQYILTLPKTIQRQVAEQGPLALVLAPTRELALQIHGEMEKMLTFCRDISCCAIVGGQNLQNQAQQLRKGVHIVVGTPGRINECIEMAYMVLNQCLYIVMDEGDRMIDMGFAPQLESILDAMGGTLKSEDEKEAYQQEEADLTNLQSGLPKHRLTAMFSATMPPEVEQMAKRYLRHPAVVSVGDQNSRKNARIVQRIVYLSSPSQKENALRNLVMDRRFMREKVLVFVNEKKHADGIGRMVERFGRRCVVLHGGKSQDQREENLAAFRQGGVVLVATDVAGRGLDITDVAHVINYDLPTRSIDNYNHRIGRTGRAGKEGLATSLMTDEDEGIMAALKSYLEATGNPVPDKLARHPAANATVERNLIH